jgi:hypothetical protein
MAMPMFAFIGFAGALLLGTSSGQEGSAEVPLPTDTRGPIIACGYAGEAYLPSNEHVINRLSLDGLTTTFTLPHGVLPNTIASYADGVNMLVGRSPDPTILYHLNNR